MVIDKFHFFTENNKFCFVDNLKIYGITNSISIENSDSFWQIQYCTVFMLRIVHFLDQKNLSNDFRCKLKRNVKIFVSFLELLFVQ